MIADIVFGPSHCTNFSIAMQSPAAPGNNECGVLIGALDPACSRIATLLQSYSAGKEGNNVVVRWVLAQGSDATEFTVARAEAGGDFTAVPEASITSTGRSYSYVDEQAEPGRTYRYRIEYREGNASRVLFETGQIKIPALPLTLYQNYPNPFNPSTTIKFYLPETADVALDVLDISGRVVASLVSGKLDAGAHAIEWRGTNNHGTSVASGAYFYHLRTGKKELVRKMILLR